MSDLWTYRLLAVLIVCSCGADWPQWRGPARDGHAAETLALPLPDKLALCWRVPIGEGYASPVVVGQDVYILARNRRDEEVCLALDAHTGALRWQYRYSAAYEPHPAARSAGKGPKATPLVVGDKVLMCGINGLLQCFDRRQGKLLWKRDFAQEFWGKKGPDGYDAWATYCGTAASPLADGHRIIVPVGGAKGGSLAAFDLDTGRHLWKALADRGSYASPVLATLAGVRQVIGFTGTRLVGLRPEDGQLLWDYPFPIAYEQTIVTPVIADELVLVSGDGQPIQALRLHVDETGQLRPRQVWRNTDLTCYMSSPVLHRGYVYGLDESGQLVCVAVANGKTQWKGGDFGTYASLLVAGDVLLALSSDADLVALRATPERYAPLARWRVSDLGKTWSHVTLAHGRLYIKDVEHLLCYRLAQQ
ncbi:MAG: hypothetical protein C4297_07120 [Gemmataceae bacterium]